MAHRDIIVVGASLGGVEAIPQLVARLPADLRAAVFIVMHLHPDAPSYLVRRLNEVGRLRAAEARDGEPVEMNRIYVAVPDRHLGLEGNRIRLSRGPRESHARPSVDVLFRSAAFSHGARVIGVVLTGMLDDGTAGLWAIKDRGGLAIAQSPEDAAYPSMPLSAIRHVAVDYILRLVEIPEVLRALTDADVRERQTAMPNEKFEIETRIALEDKAHGTAVRSLGQPSFFTCPECQGSMVAIHEGSIRRFRCHTGHGYTANALSQRGLTRIEGTLWAALAQLEEREALLREMAEAARNGGTDSESAAEHATDADETRKLADRLRALLADTALRQLQSDAAPNPKR